MTHNEVLDQLAERLESVEERVRNLEAFLSSFSKAKAQRRKSGRHPGQGPDYKPHRTWRGFVESMQVLETRARARNFAVTKQTLALLAPEGQGPRSARTITRTMRMYGLATDDWPPSSWKLEPIRELQP